MRLGLRLLFAFFVVTGFAGFFALQVFQDEVKPSVREVMEDVLVDTANMIAVQASDELRFELPRVKSPTLVITGSQDTLTPLGDAEELAELITTSRLYVLRGAAHELMAEAPNAFNDVVLRFLDEIDAAAAVPTQESA